MNRADRRRQSRQQDGTRSSALSSRVAQAFEEAVALHKSGRLSEAQTRYEAILDTHPHHADTLHLLGLLSYQTGRLDRAQSLISSAIEQEGNRAPYHFNLGLVLYRQSRLEEAAAAFRQALRLQPRYAEASSSLGLVLKDLGRLDEAVAALREAVAVKPSYADAFNNLGTTHKEQGLLRDAVESYRRALALNPNHPEAHCNLGLVLKDLDRLSEAEEAFQRALAVKPGYAKAHHGLGLVYLWQQQFGQALDAFRRAADAQHDHGRLPRLSTVYRSRVKHDADQIRYLLERKLLSADQAGYQQALQALHTRLVAGGEASNRTNLAEGELEAIAPSFSRILYYGEAPQLPGPALNPELDVEGIEGRYHARKPEILYVDQLLTEDALERLRAFCLESTIWKKDYEDGYIGAFLGEGFATPLLIQVAEELRTRFPGIFKQHRLMQAWAFKYDSTLTGLRIHADAAAVNVNFWITPDEANEDPDHGGLVVWDKEAPADWDFSVYNNTRNEPLIREFLDRSRAQAVAVPYRQNRAVIFNSNLFHQTDRLRFKDAYENRRVNITLLYGHRIT